MKKIALMLVLALAFGPRAHAQPWSGLLAPSRATDWGGAGVTGGIPNRTKVCATFNPGVASEEINIAIAKCGPNTVVQLTAGTFNLSDRGLVVWNHNDVTIRGAGANKTFLTFNGFKGNGCTRGAGSGAICVRNDAPDNWTGGPHHTAKWTAGYASGTTVITLDNTSGLSVGRMIFLDQLDDPADTGALFVNTSTAFTYKGSSQATRQGRGLTEMKTVVAIKGNQVTISPGLHMPNWRMNQSPGAWWADTTVSGVGIEDLSIRDDGAALASIFFNNAVNCWVKGVRSMTPERSHVMLYLSSRITVRDSYFYGTLKAASMSYGIETFPSSDSLFENNIFHRVAEPIMLNGASTGTVVGYNFTVENTYNSNPSWMQPHTTDHDFNALELVEGNDGQSFQSDNVHGTHAFQTLFRNFFYGDPAMTANTPIINLWAYSRYFNLIGNVLGRAGYYNAYEAATNRAIYIFGYPDEGAHVGNDPLTRTTTLRWGNYDTVTGGVRFEAAEVPSGVGVHSNPVPSTQALPPSLYLSAKPAWFDATPWPPIGPDVTAGNVPGFASHANKIPARLCYESSPKVEGVLAFDPDTCYGRSASGSAARR
jgi:hypothetical protein